MSLQVSERLPERISSGFPIDKNAKIQKLGGSWAVILNPAVMTAIGKTEATPCWIYMNKNGNLIIELRQNENILKGT